MSNRINQALGDLHELVRCRCHSGFKDRGLQDPACNCDSADSVQVVSDALSGGWKPITTAPKDTDILVWYDHDADPYQCPDDPNKLTDYADWTESGPFMDGKGHCIAKWQDALWESVDEYGAGYYMPAYWFALQNGDYEVVVNPTHWYDFGDGKPMPDAPEVE